MDNLDFVATDELEGKKPMCLPELLEKQAEKQSL